MMQAVSRRLGHPLAKLTGRRSLVPWSAIWHETCSRLEFPSTPPVRILEEDPVRAMTRMAVGEHEYWVPSGTDQACMQLCHKEIFGEGHPHYYEHLACRIRPGDVVVDAGACEGMFTRFALLRGARVLAVEPWSRMAEALERTFAAEVAAGRVRVARVLLADAPGTGTLRVHPAFPFSAASSEEEMDGLISERVPITTLDRLVVENCWSRCDFLKMDIEGAEMTAMAGAMSTLRRFRPRLSLAVYHHARGFLEISRALRAADLGYRVVAKGLSAGECGQWRPLMLHAWPGSSGAGPIQEPAAPRASEQEASCAS